MMVISGATRLAIAAAGLAGAAVLAAGCGTSKPAPTPTVTVTAPAASGHPSTSAAATSPTTSASPTVAAAPGCATSQLRVTLGVANGAAGSTYYPIDFSNTSSSPCTLFGYPGVSFASSNSASSSVVGAPAQRTPGPEHLVTLQPGHTVHATLQVVDALNFPSHTCKPVSVHYLRVYPPNQRSSVFVGLGTTACAAASVKTLNVEPVTHGTS